METPSLSIFDPASPQAEAIRSLSVLVLAICAFIFFVVEGILLYAIVRFRRRATRPLTPGPSPSEGRGETEPPQVYGSKPIEIAWTAAPALIVFVLVLVSARTLWEVDVDPPAPEVGDNALFVTVVGRQWWWEYRYTHYNGRERQFITANELHVPAGSKVYLALQSADVCHSFWVPRLAGKMDLIPGRTNHLLFQCAQPGLYLGQCAEYCGTQHAGMLLRVYVDPPETFAEWVDREEKPAVEVKSLGDEKKVFLAQSCVNCHRVRGTAAQGTYAPDLTHLMSRETLASGMFKNTDENLRQWVKDPQKLKPGCLMPAFGLSTLEQDQVVRYLQALR